MIIGVATINAPAAIVGGPLGLFNSATTSSCLRLAFTASFWSFVTFLVQTPQESMHKALDHFLEYVTETAL